LTSSIKFLLGDNGNWHSTKWPFLFCCRNHLCLFQWRYVFKSLRAAAQENQDSGCNPCREKWVENKARSYDWSGSGEPPLTWCPDDKYLYEKL
jgi:hypothetical protein